MKARRNTIHAAPAPLAVPGPDVPDDFEHCAECGAALPVDSRFCRQCEAGKTPETGSSDPAQRLYQSAWRFAAMSFLVIEAAPLALWQASRAWKANE